MKRLINSMAKGKLKNTHLNRVDALIERYSYHLYPRVYIDIDRMKEALKGPFYTLPRGLDAEGIRKFMLDCAGDTDNRPVWPNTGENHEQ
ncbi:hypothetical protein [Pseudomonas chlororaphis]|uniref:hypothetical protein n=1 Tax=Pseudomonas chlororaphis TaxID=587753 RepID=UPI0015DE9B9C|nr:hypothetical protein [Pseudomonas chlororaphis]QLL11746.1 hypothetical protein H0I86_22335 [Pseudomonas chlororaphis subsp. aurantiaca]